MKTRSDFVTNSSSSSFIVMFDYQPESWNDLHNIMFFNEDKGKCLPCIHHPSEDVSQRVFDDIKKVENGYETWVSLPKGGGEYRPDLDVWDIIKQNINNLIYLKSYYKSNNNCFSLRDSSDIEYKIIQEEDIPYTAAYLFKQETGKNTYDLYNDEGTSKKEKEKIKKVYQNLKREFDKKVDKLVDKATKKLKELFPDSYFVVLSYADEEGETLLEHGDIFRNVPHIKISNH